MQIAEEKTARVDAGKMTTNGNRVPPGPKGWPLIGVSMRLLRDPLGLMRHMAREYGDIVRIPVVMQSRILLNHPDYIEQMLLLQHGKFHKSNLSKQATGRLLGQGLLISEGDFWRRQRRLAQPAFHRQRIGEYSPAMIECAESQMRKWRSGETRNLAEEMMELTLEAAVRTLFGTTLPGEPEQVGRAVQFLMRYSLRRARSPIHMPASWPTPKNRRAEREYDFLDSLVYRIIDERRAQGNSHHCGDLLSLLMGAMDEDGSQMTPKQLRDETMTLFLAGHETTALTLAWTWYLLSENPAAEANLHEELNGVLGGRTPVMADLERLPYLRAVIDEALRLYPPAYILARTSIAPCSIGGYDFPVGTTMIASEWVMHRDPRYFDDPDMFRPERWIDGLAERLPAGAYFPFGDGPRRCIGQSFALVEAALVVATIAQKYQFRLVSGFPVVPEPLVTLRPKHGIQMTILARS
jgi:cytochrome P450